MNNCVKYYKDNLLHRASLRGIKKCPSCGAVNGQRAILCRNEDCELRQKTLLSIKPFDPIQLITYKNTKFYSLRSKEKLLNPRTFVEITEEILTHESPNTEIVSRNAVCYVETCKYDASNLLQIGCKHVNACLRSKQLRKADVYPFEKSILWSLNISEGKKETLWQLYENDLNEVGPIQRINSNTFVVKCAKSAQFPAGRLHVTVFCNSVANKKGTYSCACKKLKIVLLDDESVSMLSDICDHLLLLLVSILSHIESKTTYSHFLDTMKFLWVPTIVNPPIAECAIADSTTSNTSNISTISQNSDYNSPNSHSSNASFINYMDIDNFRFDGDLSSLADAKIDTDSHNSSDLFNFTEELFAENHIPDFSDIIMEVDNANMTGQRCKTDSCLMKNKINDLNIKDDKLFSSSAPISDDDIYLTMPTVMPEPQPQSPVDLNENSLGTMELFQLHEDLPLTPDNHCVNGVHGINATIDNILQSHPLQKQPQNLNGFGITNYSSDCSSSNSSFSSYSSNCSKDNNNNINESNININGISINNRDIIKLGQEQQYSQFKSEQNQPQIQLSVQKEKLQQKRPTIVKCPEVTSERSITINIPLEKSFNVSEKQTNLTNIKTNTKKIATVANDTLISVTTGRILLSKTSKNEQEQQQKNILRCASGDINYDSNNRPINITTIENDTTRFITLANSLRTSQITTDTIQTIPAVALLSNEHNEQKSQQQQQQQQQITLPLNQINTITNIVAVTDVAVTTTTTLATKVTDSISVSNTLTPLLPTIKYVEWLDHIIEVLNDSIIIQDCENIRHSFHVYEDIFVCFSKNFIFNNKKRLPSTTTLMKSGRYKGLTKYSWYFTQRSIVQRIFATKNFKLEVERLFELIDDGSFRLYQSDNSIKELAATKGRLIQPKIKLYTAYMKFQTNDKDKNTTNHILPLKTGLKLDWLPLAFPKSRYGLMTIEFCVSVKDNQ